MSTIIGPEGGTLSVTGSSVMTVTVPPGAVSGPTSFSLSTITNTSPNGIGDAFRIDTAGVQLAAPMTLSWTMPAGATVDQVTAAYQDASGYWFRVYTVTRDSTAQVLSTQSTFVGDWSLLYVATVRDLMGPFQLDSTEGVPMTATGTVTMQWVGDDAGFAYYLPQGSITLTTPLSSGAATCTPNAGTPATQSLPFSVAEIRNDPAPVQFRWGINGRWELSCSDGTQTQVSTDFDSLGITNIGCARSYTTGLPTTISTTHLQGQYLIDCTSMPGPYKVVASWDLVPVGATPGALPPPPAPWP